MELDHVLIAVADLTAAAHELAAGHGLVSVPGGRHAGLGTANRIVPLGDTYLELVAAVDRAEARESVFGSWVAGAKTPRLLGWCVRVDDLEPVAGRLGLTIAVGSRTREDGVTLHWRMAGLEQASEEPSLPFLIEWGAGTPYPGSTPVAHPIGSPTIEELRIMGDLDRLERWLGGAALPLSVRKGAPALESLVLNAGEEHVVLDYAR